MSEFRISSAQLQQYSQGPGPLASDSERGSHQTEAKSRLHEMARDLISSAGQVKSGYLRLLTGDHDQVSVTTNRWQRSRQTDAATDLVRQLVKDAYGQNDQVEAALNAYLGSSAKNNKLGTRSFVKLVAELDRATTGQVQDQRLAGVLQGRVGSLKTDLFAASFRLQQQRGRALALRERLGPLLQEGANPQERRQVASELIALRNALNNDFSSLSDKTLRQSSSLLMLDIEQNIDELLQVHCQDLSQAMDHAATYQVGRDGNAFGAMQSLQSLQGELRSLQALQDQTDYPILSLNPLDALGRRAGQVLTRFVDAQAARQRDPRAALTKAGVTASISDAQALEPGRSQLAELSQDRRQTLLNGYAQARKAFLAGQPPAAGMAQIQARWQEQTTALAAQTQSVVNQIEQHHDQSLAQLEQACESLRQDMDEASMPRFEGVKTALNQSLTDARDRLKLGAQTLMQDRLGPPQTELAELLARAQWREAGPLLAASQAGPADLAELARALDVHAQPDELARFMKALVPADARSRIDFLAQAFPRGAEASANSGPHLATLAALEQIDPGSRLALLGGLGASVGRHNPGSEALKGGADGQVLRLDDKAKVQSLASARQALVSVASPKVNLQGADLSGSVVHFEYRREHNTQAWAPKLTGARLDQARIVLDLSDLPRRVNKKTGATELDFDRVSEMVLLFGFDTSMDNWEIDQRTDYFNRHPDAEELPDAVLEEIAEGPPARAGLHTLLSSISAEHPQQRKEVACQLLDMALQVPYATFEDEDLGARSPMFKEIKRDAALMADPDIALRLSALSKNGPTREAARKALAQRAIEPG